MLLMAKIKRIVFLFFVFAEDKIKLFFILLVQKMSVFSREGCDSRCNH